MITHERDHWYNLYGGCSCWEYNTGKKPFAELHQTRNPQAAVFRHIDGNKCVAKIKSHPEKLFFYKDSNYDHAFNLAVQFVDDFMINNATQYDIFNMI